MFLTPYWYQFGIKQNLNKTEFSFDFKPSTKEICAGFSFLWWFSSTDATWKTEGSLYNQAQVALQWNWCIKNLKSTIEAWINNEEDELMLTVIDKVKTRMQVKHYLKMRSAAMKGGKEENKDSVQLGMVLFGEIRIWMFIEIRSLVIKLVKDENE